MHKKLIVACAALAAFASLAAAPVASASPALTNGGTPVPVGTEIKGSNTGVFLFEDGIGYSVSCGQATLAAKVTANSGTKIKMEAAAGGLTLTGTAVAGDCTTSRGATSMTWGKMCFETGATDNVIVTGCGANIAMTTNITGLVICQYTISGVTASFPTNADATFNLSSIPLKKSEGSGAFCPSEIKFSLDLDLTTTSGQTLLIS
jgi:hypothetical protein